jgi:DNA-binding transcriptional LysR family regulator
MSKVIAGFRERHPGIGIQLCVGKPAEIAPWLQRGEVDFGLKYGLEFERDVHLIYTDWAPIRAVLSPAHPLAHHKDLQLAQLTRHPLALPGAATTIQRALNMACNGENLRYRVLYSGDVGTMLSIAALGDAVVLAGDIAIRGFLQAGGMRVLPVRHSLFDHRRVMLMSPLAQPLSRLAAVFADDIVKALRAYSPDALAAQPADGGLELPAGSEGGPVA